MAFEQAVEILLSLRERLPVGDTETGQVRRLLEQLEQSAVPARRREIVERVLPLLLGIEEVRGYVRPIFWELANSEEPAGTEVPEEISRGDAFDVGEVVAGDFVLDFHTSFSRGPLRGVRGSRRARVGSPPIRQGQIERTPHLDVNQALPIQAGSSMKVTVYLDEEELHEGEHGEKLKLPDLQELRLGVSLSASAHFSIRSDAQAEIILRGGEPRSTSAVFEVDCLGDAEGQPGMAASFVHQWRPAGSVSRPLEIAGTVKERSGTTEDPPPPAISVDLAARAPDLLVEIRESPDGDERHFDLTVSSPHLEALRDGVKVKWSLKRSTKDIVEGFMEGFTSSNGAGRKSALIGAGKDLFDLTPEVFKEAFWELAEGGMLKTIFVVTSEPFIPWELMVPNDGLKERAPLGVEFAIGRWVHEGHVSPPQMLLIKDSYVIAPRYRADKKLKFSAAEAQFVLGVFGGEQILPARIESIDSKLAERGATLLHLICHGSEQPSGQVLDLDPDETLRDWQLGGLKGLVKAVADQRPFVFVNACNIGRASPALVGTGGFAARFTRLGARCVIAPIWSVKDVVAEQVARKFYERIQAEPWTPFAEILRDIRRLAYEGDDPEDSYAAYCFYGDPLAAQCVMETSP